ncbi:MAG: HDOD domain-containing protein [Smithellaceae bacterium]
MKTDKDINIPDIVSDIPSLPVVASRMLQIIADENASLEELKRVISLDQSFTGRLLRIANSPYYRAQKNIADITDAITRIGFTTVQALVFAISLRDLRRSTDQTDRLLWDHNLAVSVAAGLVGNNAGFAGAGEVLIYGLLHDIGKVFINLSFKKEYAEVLRRVREDQIPFNRAEQAVFGFDHCDVGSQVARQWRLPETLVFAIANHHDSDLLALTNAEQKKKTLTVKTADALCSASGLGLACSAEMTDAEWQFMKLASAKKREALSAGIEQEYNSYRDFVLGQNSHT